MIMNNAMVLVCCHKKDFFYDGDGFLPIQVGKALSSVDLGIHGDDTGDNISEKNPHFCELTAQYWLWKNVIKTDYVGLNHYRRYFDFNKKYSGGYFFQNLPSEQATDKKLSLPGQKGLDSIFQKYDIILAPPMVYPVSLDIHYSAAHDKDDLLAIREILKTLYPDYLPSFDRVMTGNKLSLCNMFIMRKETFDDYSKWLFDILFTLEKRGKTWSDSYQARVYGFLSERLLNVYVSHNNLRIKYCPVIKISEDKPLSQIKGFVKNSLYNIAYSIIKSGEECKIINKLTKK